MTESQHEFIRDNCHILKDKEIAAILSRYAGQRISHQAVRDARHRMGIEKVRGSGPSRIKSRRDEAPSGD